MNANQHEVKNQTHEDMELHELFSDEEDHDKDYVKK